MGNRGSYNFEVGQNGALCDSDGNKCKLRDLFRDSRIIDGNWGPGDPGDFDHGSWHILCHLAAGSGVLNTPFGRAWCGITYVPTNDTYEATITCRQDGVLRTLPLKGTAGTSLANGAQCLGFIEGTSLGHVTARGVVDSATAFNGWTRQSFDQDLSSSNDGGTVWEHWVTTRDIRPTNATGTSVLEAYLTLVCHLGGRFVAAVGRGRREHDHPRQLVALVKSGFLTVEEATWNVSPDPIPKAPQDLLYEARPADSLVASELLPFSEQHQRYFMFERRIRQWSKAEDVRKDLNL